MDESAYFKERLDEQIQWYDKKSEKNQLYFKFFKILELILSCSIPLVSIFLPENYSHLLRPIMISIGTSLSILTGFHAIFKYHDNWINYRSTSELLKREKYLYLAKSDIYSSPHEDLSILAERVECIIAKENSSWIRFSSFNSKRNKSSYTSS